MSAAADRSSIRLPSKDVDRASIAHRKLRPARDGAAATLRPENPTRKMKRAPALGRGSCDCSSRVRAVEGKGAQPTWVQVPSGLRQAVPRICCLRPSIQTVWMKSRQRDAEPLVVGFGDNLAVMVPVGIAPTHGLTGWAALPGVILGLPGKLAVAIVEVLADGVADDAADDRTREGRRHLAAALAELMADDAADDGARPRSPAPPCSHRK